MSVIPSHVLYGVLLFVLLMVLLLVVRPASMFDAAGRPRPFGTGPEHTLFSLGVLTVVLAVASTFIFAFLEILASRMPLHIQ